MRGFTTFILLFISISCSFAQEDIKLVIDSSVNLITENKVKFGIIYSNKKGKEKEKGDLFNKPLPFSIIERMNIRINDDLFKGVNSEIFLTENSLIKTGGIISIRYHHPKNPKIEKNDTLRIPLLTDLELIDIPENFDQHFTLKAKYYFNDGSSKIYEGEELKTILIRNVVKLEFENAEQTGILSGRTFPFKNSIDSAFINIKICSPNIKKQIKNPFSFKGEFAFNASGDHATHASRYDSGPNGNDGGYVNVNVNQFNDSLFTASLVSNNKEKTIVFHPKRYIINIDARGGNGGDGGRGYTGEDGSGDSKGEQGGRGFDGGDGGRGGQITIFYPPSFGSYLSIIKTNVIGGTPGDGGRGGKGGINPKPEGEKTTFLDVLFPDRAQRGPDGRKGRPGQQGSVQYIPID